jgi:hypothetical protein
MRQGFSRLLGTVAYEAAMSARRKIPRDFKLKRPWIVQGIRFEKPRTEFSAKVFSLDPLMEKHEEGASFYTRALIQSRYLQARGRYRSDQPRQLLERPSYFINDRGIFERRPQNKLRSWYRFSSSRHYSSRLKLKETVEETASLIVRDASRYMVIQ